MTVAFRGANNPKLANVIVSQNTRITRNGTGTERLGAGKHQPPGLQQRLGEVQRTGLERPLGVVARL